MRGERSPSARDVLEPSIRASPPPHQSPFRRDIPNVVAWQAVGSLELPQRISWTAAIACGCGRAVSPTMLGAGGLPPTPPSTGLKHGYGAGLRTSDRPSID